ncbi:Pentatricopeptide repeat-containing protein [Thalictrum thalictroides]|uniref:Pentatricopeptide repeat-containing protein n=1 Tax=Thalictrum thalictroides TaxID=46969 RepID=A0A7J6W7M1_THATH|nr:Pentatricopeptide repeat-containing protein [Thalictrum thalictroides]
MIAILARHGKDDLVDQLISKVKRERIQLSFSTVRLIIDFYGISKKPDAALNVFYDVETISGAISQTHLMLLYSSLLRTLIKCKRGSNAMDLLEEMILSGIHPDMQTFTGLMQYFALDGDLRTVQKLFGMVRQSGVDPDAYMFQIIVRAYCKRERAALGLRVYEDMRNSNLIPDSATKALLVKSLWKEGKLREAAYVEEISEEVNDKLPIALPGHLWTVSTADLTRVYDIYFNSIAT